MTEATPEGRPDAFRLFFALWPDETTRDALNQTGKWLHKHWGGRRMRADTLHVTLAFLGRTPTAQLDRLIELAGRVRAGPYALTLDQAGYWRHNRIGWLGASATPAAHFDLVAALNAELLIAGFPVDPRPHVPHVTLLRNSGGGDAPACKPVHWDVSGFVLVKSETASDGARYEVVERWRLDATPAR